MKNKNFKSIKTFSDACIAVGTTEDLFYQKYGYLTNYLLNVGKLEIINKAINGEWIPNWGDLNEYKYYPYFTMSVSSGFGFSGSDYGCFGCSGSDVGSRLCTYNKDVALYIGEQFNDLYLDWFCLEDEKKINFITITLDDMEKIHSIACEKWKDKIIKLTNEHKDENPFINKVYLPKQIVDEMINACTQEQLPIVKKIFGK